MGLLKDFLDLASGGAISRIEADLAHSRNMAELDDQIRRFEKFEKANEEFNSWCYHYRDDYNMLARKLEGDDYLVDRSILHSRSDIYGELYTEETNENERRRQKLEDTIKKLQKSQLKKDNEKFQVWFDKHSSSYVVIRKALNDYSYQVNLKKYESLKTYSDLDEVNKKRQTLLETQLEELSYKYTKKRFKNYLTNNEQLILDSYNSFRIFQVEMSHLPAFQKECIDSVYLKEIRKLFDNKNHEEAETMVNDLAWQIKKHKVPAGHAIVLLILAQKVYKDNEGFSDDMKAKIDGILIKTEDIVIENTYKKYLNEDSNGLDAEAMLQIGKESFINGEPEKAFAYYLCAAQKGNAEAQYRTGLCFEKGLGVFINNEKAIYWYKKSLKSKNPISKYYMATVYHWLLPKDQQNYKKALSLYQEAFSEGVIEAAINIGNMYMNGQGVEQDTQIAVDWYKKGASAGSPRAMFDLYKLYLSGKGVEQDKEKAKQWFVKCNEVFDTPDDKCSPVLRVGCDSLMFEMAYEYCEGSNALSKSLEQSIIWAQKGALIGDLKSINLLAQLYFESGKSSDAITYLQYAEEYGSAEAMNTLGMIYCDENDDSLETDNVLANERFSRAAKFGNSLSQFNTGYGFLHGTMGLPSDLYEARYWFALSAEQGNRNSKEILDNLNAEDIEKHKKEVEIEKKRIQAEIAEIDKKIENAQSQREEDALLKKKNLLMDKIAKLV